MNASEQSYQTVCRACNQKITLDLGTWTATGRDHGEVLTTTLTVNRKRTKHGDLWGGLETVTWLCPLCGKTHEDKSWTPDNQIMLPGFDWGLVK